ncbi:NUDIX domain-containing protein [Streptomyces sp. SID13031]|uniref:NUDIX domain-containing protein n=1 Tax=Streptomyces sp. SID13031 TaxID=2706046 RepID=UPI0013C6CB0C|nr:NUDIX domain-containing protein [Streptomyces sp. SID13031]NEA33088.1 NUDIX domain-containing protein [Streptomyces sp. SID13031]
MVYEGSYLWQLRQVVGQQLLLMPGAQVVVVDDRDQVLFQQRKDSGLWELPGGAAEPGMSFRETAAQELLEESGLRVEPVDLVPFGSLSEAELHTITYPNGDRLQCYALLFEARQWTGDLVPGADEVIQARFFEAGEAPEPLQPQTEAVWQMYAAYRATGLFQAR